MSGHEHNYDDVRGEGFFGARRGASDEDTLQGSVRSEQRSLAEKELPPEGLRRIWPVAALLVGHRSTSGYAPSSRLATGQLRRNERHRSYVHDHLVLPLETTENASGAWRADQVVSETPEADNMKDATVMLAAIEAGDSKAAEQLLVLVYDELRRLAASKIAGEAPGQTLQPTALVHEARAEVAINLNGRRVVWDVRPLPSVKGWMASN